MGDEKVILKGWLAMLNADVQPDVVVIQDGVEQSQFTPVMCREWTRQIRPGCHVALRMLRGFANAKPLNAKINNQRGFFAPKTVCVGDVFGDVVTFYSADAIVFDQPPWETEADLAELVV